MKDAGELGWAMAFCPGAAENHTGSPLQIYDAARRRMELNRGVADQTLDQTLGQGATRPRLTCGLVLGELETAEPSRTRTPGPGVDHASPRSPWARTSSMVVTARTQSSPSMSKKRVSTRCARPRRCSTRL